jgi:hypothetical protein
MTYLIAVPVYSLIRDAGISFADYPNLAYFILTLLVVNLSVSIMLVYFFRFIARYNLSTKTRLLYTFALGFCTLLFPYTFVLNNHALTAAFLFFTFYALLNSKKPMHFAGAGLLAGLTATFEMVTGSIFLACFIGYLIWKKTKFPNILCFVCAALLPLIIYFLINISITGNIVPLQLNKEYFNYPGSPFAEGANIIPVRGNTAVDKINYACDILLGSKGFFVFSPLLLFSLAGLIITIKQIPKYRKEAITNGIGIILALIIYSIQTVDWGGSNFGFRHTVPLIPILFAYTPVVFKKYKNPLLKILFGILVLVAVYISIIGIMRGPWAQ